MTRIVPVRFVSKRKQTTSVISSARQNTTQQPTNAQPNHTHGMHKLFFPSKLVPTHRGVASVKTEHTCSECDKEADTDFGQTDFGHPYLTDFGQNLGWPTLAKPT